MSVIGGVCGYQVSKVRRTERATPGCEGGVRPGGAAVVWRNNHGPDIRFESQATFPLRSVFGAFVLTHNRLSDLADIVVFLLGLAGDFPGGSVCRHADDEEIASCGAPSLTRSFPLSPNPPLRSPSFRNERSAGGGGRDWVGDFRGSVGDNLPSVCGHRGCFRSSGSEIWISLGSPTRRRPGAGTSICFSTTCSSPRPQAPRTYLMTGSMESLIKTSRI